MHLKPDFTIKHVIIACCYCCCCLVLSATPESTTAALACDLVSSDRSKCYNHRTLHLNFEEARSFCGSEFRSQLPSTLLPDDEDRIAGRVSLSFWFSSKFQLHHDQSRNRVDMISSYANVSSSKWDFTAMDPEVFWANGSYCAQAVDSWDTSRGRVMWAPRSCRETAQTVLCERPLEPEPPAPVTLEDHGQRSIGAGNQTDSAQAVLEEVLDSKHRVARPDDGDAAILIAAVFVLTRSSFYVENLKNRLILVTLAGVLAVCVLMAARVAYRRLRRSSSAYFTVQGMALVYVRSDLTQSEVPRSTCTSFMMRGCE